MKLKKSSFKQWAVQALVCLCALALIMLGHRYFTYDSIQQSGEEAYSAKVMEVLSTQGEPGGEQTVFFSAQLGDGAQVQAEQYIDPRFPPVSDPVEPGDRVVLIDVQLADGQEWVYSCGDRTQGLIVLVGLFFLLILLMGRGKGVATLVSLVMTVAVIFWVYIPGILAGKNLYWLTVAVATFVILVSLLLLNAWNLKTLCAVVGNLGGILLAGLIALATNALLDITGVLDHEYIYLTMLGTDVVIDLQAVVWGGIIIGCLGAIMDVAMTIASAMQELAEEMESPSFSRLTGAGMRIGQDAIGTMTNTLILAYTGGALASVLLFTAYNRDPLVVMNMEKIVVEVIRAVVGSMGILVTVPLTVFFSAWMHLKRGTGKGKTKLTRAVLETYLIGCNIPRAAFDLEGGTPDDTYCMGEIPGGFQVYHCRGGVKEVVAVTSTEAEACQRLVALIGTNHAFAERLK